MGRTVPTFRQLIDDAIARWSKFRRALRREDQEYFDRLFRRVRSYTQAATYQASDNPMEAILLSIALDQEKRLDALEHIAVLPPEKILKQLDAPRSPDENEQPDKQLDTQLDTTQQLDLLSGWLFDLYPSPHGMKLWLIDPNQTRHRLIDRFTPSFYVSGAGCRPAPPARSGRAAAARAGLPRHRAHGFMGAARPSRCWKSKSRIPTNSFVDALGAPVRFRAAALQQRPDARLAVLLAARRVSAGSRRSRSRRRGPRPRARMPRHRMGDRLRTATVRNPARAPGRPQRHRSPHASFDKGGARNRGGRPPVRTRRIRRARRGRLPASARAARSRPDPERLGRRHDPARSCASRPRKLRLPLTLNRDPPPKYTRAARAAT